MKREIKMLEFIRKQLETATKVAQNNFSGDIHGLPNWQSNLIKTRNELKRLRKEHQKKLGILYRGEIYDYQIEIIQEDLEQIDKLVEFAEIEYNVVLKSFLKIAKDAISHYRELVIIVDPEGKTNYREVDWW